MFDSNFDDFIDDENSYVDDIIGFIPPEKDDDDDDDIDVINDALDDCFDVNDLDFN